MIVMPVIDMPVNDMPVNVRPIAPFPSQSGVSCDALALPDCVADFPIASPPNRSPHLRIDSAPTAGSSANASAATRMSPFVRGFRRFPCLETEHWPMNRWLTSDHEIRRAATRSESIGYGHSQESSLGLGWLSQPHFPLQSEVVRDLPESRGNGVSQG